MKEYELIWEIFNKCPRNQMRDVFVEELELEDPEEYIRNKFKGKEVSYEKTVLEVPETSGNCRRKGVRSGSSGSSV